MSICSGIVVTAVAFNIKVYRISLTTVLSSFESTQALILAIVPTRGWLSLKPSGTEDLRQYVRSVKEGEHGCIIYEDEDRMWDLEVEYLRSGIESGYLGVVLVTENRNKVREALIRRGMDVDRYVKEGSLMIVDGDQLYGSAKNPNIPAWLDAVKSVVDGAVKSGKKGVRVSGNLSYTYFARQGFAEQWWRLENSLHRNLGLPCTAICTYDVSELAPSERPYALKDLLEHYRRIGERNPQVMDAHSFAIFASHEGGAIAELTVPVY